MRKTIPFLLIPLTLSSCIALTPEQKAERDHRRQMRLEAEQAEEIRKNDARTEFMKTRCQNYGFALGTNELEGCVGNTSALKGMKIIVPNQKNYQFPMVQVINDCFYHHKFSNFSEWVTCIKVSYANYGTAPDNYPTLNFIAHLNAIDEDYRKQNISFSKAHSQMIDAWRITIDADNQRSAGANPQQGFANSLSETHRILRGIDPANNQKHIDQICYGDCLGAGRSAGLCISKCSY